MSRCQTCGMDRPTALPVVTRCPMCGETVGWSDQATTGVVPDAMQPDSGSDINQFDPNARTSLAIDLINQLLSSDNGATVIQQRSADPAAAAGGNGQEVVGEPPRPRPANPDVLATINPRNLSAEQLKTMELVWKGWATDDAGPHVSGKSNTSSTVIGASLVIQSRSVRKPTEDTDTRADYELLDVVGEGGVGVVFSARQASIDRVVAVKMLKPSITADIQHRDKFLSEAVVTGELDHPNIVPIYDLGSNSDGDLFYSMKLVRGTPWSAVIDEKNLPENLAILLKVADAVAFAHARGVVHRDLKPENVMLGDFGEVLVMDWGIAISTSLHTRSDEARRSICMGGTPAYMAPEMVTGPIDLIGVTSDVYLLGAILFEISSGILPHYGETVLDCLRAAARNDIQDADQQGELIEIAYRAMATDPAERYQSVLEFQDAIREYQSHSESIAMVCRAEEDLKAAEESYDYQLYSRTIFAYEEALALWSRNSKARTGLETAKLSYAHCACTKGDYELGMSLLDRNKRIHRPLYDQMDKALREREARQGRFKRFRTTVQGLLLLMFLVVTAFSIFVAKQRQALEQQYAELRVEKNRAEQQQQRAEEATTRAKRERINAENNTREMKLSQRLLRQSAIEALLARQSAAESREIAQYEKYTAQIGLAAAKIEQLSLRAAKNLLNDYADSHLRHWEWGRLRYTHGISSETFGGGKQTESRNDRASLVYRRVRLRARNSSDPEMERTVRLLHAEDRFLIDSALSPGDGYLTAASNAPTDVVTLWELPTGQLLRESSPAMDAPEATLCLVYTDEGQLLSMGSLDGASAICKAIDGSSVVSVSPDGRLVVSTSWEATAKIWDARTGRTIARLVDGHTRALTGAMFSPDGHCLLTMGVDGRAVLWNWDPASQQPPRPRLLAQYDAPIQCAAFSPRAELIITACQDGRATIWDAHQQGSIVSELVSEATSTVLCASFSIDGRWVATGSHDQRARIWEVRGGRLVAEVHGHTAPVNAVAFSPDARRLLTGSGDHSIKLWDTPPAHTMDGQQVAMLQELLTLNGHRDEVSSVAFSANGQFVLSCSRDGTAIIWPSEFIPPAIYLSEHAGADLLPPGTNLSADVADPTADHWRRLDPTARVIAPHTGSFDQWSLLVELDETDQGRWQLRLPEGPEPNNVSFEADERDEEVEQVVLDAGSRLLHRVPGCTSVTVVGTLETKSPNDRLVVQLNERATAGMIQQLLRQVEYQCLASPDSPDMSGSTTLRVVLSDHRQVEQTQATRLIRLSRGGR